ncbi:MAG: DegV family protein [Bacteroidales bacterium]|nr:DegV family protein [Clostridium sp.]MCM1204164.1 DegV family protein [Bacteroidales bacterium]
MSYTLASDATLDLPMDLVEKYHIAVVPMAFNLDGEEILHYPDERNMTTEDFYSALKAGKTSSTSQINPAVYVEFFTPILEKGEDILYICFTSGLSGTYQSALLARDMLKEDFPEREICVVDSLCASAGQGYFVYLAAKKKEEGLSMEELEAWAVENRNRIAHWFTVDDLFHLQRGGRLSFAEAMLGSALKIKPIISVDDEGKLYVENKVRGNKKSVEYMIQKVNDTMDEKEHTLFIGHGDAEERALELKEKLLERTEARDIRITKIGPIIGSHTGPGMLAVLFTEKGTL